MVAVTPRLQERQCGGRAELSIPLSDFRSLDHTSSIPLFQVQKKDTASVLAQYRFLTSLRQSELPFQRGWFCHVHADANIFAYLRELDGLDQAFLMVLNFGKELVALDLSAVLELPDQLTVLMSTSPANDGKVLQKSSILTQAGEGLVIQYSTSTRFHATHSGQCSVSEKACYLKVMDILHKC